MPGNWKPPRPLVSVAENKSDIRSARLEAHAERTGETQGER
ncbi:hypothetical protein DAD186_05460 [Dermabacter vaginalis]|uniref:Uncharacterized protein n=1 Tax=Dermabacter vaginalis TaxID=1630135 RepID=A0A1B0ZGP4_9MICO|nr:hypothetical protein DAD186_05460 [Dermabacter vaginalis]